MANKEANELMENVATPVQIAGETTKEMVIRKLTSRKLWAAVCNLVTMLMIARGCSEAAAAQVAAIIMAGAGVLAYIISEGLTDAAGAGNPQSDMIEFVDSTTPKED